MTLNKNNDPLALEEIYLKAVFAALDGQNGERYFLQETCAQGVDIPERFRGYYKAQLKHYWWCGWKARALRVTTAALIAALLLFCVFLCV